MWIHGKPGASYIFSAKEHSFPMLAAVDGAKDAAFLLRSGSASKGADKYDVGIRGMPDDAADAAGIGKTHVGPGFPGVGGFIDSVAHYVAIANHPRLASSHPNDARVGRCNGQSADGCGGLLGQDRCPTTDAGHLLSNSDRGRTIALSGLVTLHARHIC